MRVEMLLQVSQLSWPTSFRGSREWVIHRDKSKGAADSTERQRLRHEIDAIVPHLCGLSRDDFDHIPGPFPLVFPDTDTGRGKRSELLGVRCLGTEPYEARGSVK